MAIRISTVEPADLPRWVELHRAILPEPPSPIEPSYSVEAIAAYLLANPKQQRLLAAVDGRPAGLGRTSSSPNARARGGIYAFVAVAAEFRGRGLGTRLYRAVSEWAEQVGAAALVLQLFESEEQGIAWAARRGFAEIARERRLALDLASVPTPAVEPPEGVALTTLAERPDLLRGVYELALEAEPDVPGTEEIELPSFEEWRRSEFGWALNRPEAVFVATTATGVVGAATLDLREGGLAVHMGTSVRRAWRRRGLARALKSTQIAWAKETGYTRLETSNDTRNEPILRLNESFGYTERPGVLTLRGPLAPS
ncbi:MAG TPA: GNAT family N-acetyltransferase [Gaiellaceae bacterium]|nr:GNAT family N-acetyltransferase [Gaiellaceae bacterium]